MVKKTTSAGSSDTSAGIGVFSGAPQGDAPTTLGAAVRDALNSPPVGVPVDQDDPDRPLTEEEARTVQADALAAIADSHESMAKSFAVIAAFCNELRPLIALGASMVASKTATKG